MASSAAELLEQVDAAITRALTSQSWTNRGRSLQMANLAELRKFRAELLQEIDSEGYNGGSMASVGEVQRPS